MNAKVAQFALIPGFSHSYETSPTDCHQIELRITKNGKLINFPSTNFAWTSKNDRVCMAFNSACSPEIYRGGDDNFLVLTFSSFGTVMTDKSSENFAAIEDLLHWRREQVVRALHEAAQRWLQACAAADPEFDKQDVPLWIHITFRGRESKCQECALGPQIFFTCLLDNTHNGDQAFYGRCGKVVVKFGGDVYGLVGNTFSFPRFGYLSRGVELFLSSFPKADIVGAFQDLVRNLLDASKEKPAFAQDWFFDGDKVVLNQYKYKDN